MGAAVMLLPCLAAAQRPSGGGQAPSAGQAPAPAPPQAPRMASDEVLALLEKGDVFFLDVREPKELEELGTFEGYVNIPVRQLEKRLAEVPGDMAIITA